MYRSPPSLPRLAPKASLWRRFLAWRRGTFRKMEEREQRRIEDARKAWRATLLERFELASAPEEARRYSELIALADANPKAGLV